LAALNSSSLGADLDPLLDLGLLHFRYHDGQYAVLHTGFDVVVVHGIGKGEAAGKFTDAAFRHPVGVLWVVCGDVLRSSGRHFGVGGGLRGFIFTIGIDLGGSGGRTFLSDALSPALDGNCLFVGELNDDVFLFNARKFALENVAVFSFLNIELGSERARRGVGELLKFREGVIEEVEEWAHFMAVGSKGTWEAWEEGHFSCLDVLWL